MSFQKYPEYKESGIEWLGEVPAHWVVGPLRWYTTIQGGVAKGKSYSDDTPTVDLPYLRVANVQDGHVDLSSVNTVTVALYEVDRYRLSPGDVLMNEGGDNDKLGRGTVWEGEIANCLHQNHVFAIRPNQHLLPYWLSMFTRSSAARSYFYLYSKQSTNLASISSSNVMACPLPLPPVEEQQHILGFLDHETSRIDALVEQQQRLIALLKEKRQAVISHAVTKGLDADVPMKDSGVEWLGEVPVHWGVFRLKQIVTVQGGATPAKERLDFWNGQIPWISPKDMKKDRVSDSSDHITEKALSEIGLSMINPGAVLIVVRGMILAHSVPVAITEAPLTINQDMKAVTPCDQLVSEYMLLLLVGLKDAIFNYIDSSAHGTKKLEWERFENIELPLPALTEQRSICRKLHEEVERIYQLIDTATLTMKLLKERRSALISAAVTGKIDVRGWKAEQYSEQPEVLTAAEERATYA